MKESQLLPYEHSEIKVRLLKLYLDRYINILALAKGVEDVHVYDLFCGEGIYDNKKEGSPVIILRNLKEIVNGHKEAGKSVGKFHCHFNDVNANKLKKLEGYVLAKGLYDDQIGKVSYSNKDYQVLKDEIASAINAGKKKKSFVFLDPYGYKDITVSDVESFLRSGHSEVLLFLPTQFMYRFEQEGTPDSLWNFISELMPNENWGVSDSGIDFINKLRDAFREKMKNNGHYVDSFIITRDKNEYFALFFFTSHLYGFEKFLEAKWEIDEEEGRGWSPVQTSVNLFSDAEVRPNTDKFEQNLKAYLCERRSNVDVHKFTIENGHLVPHAVQILKSLQDSGKLSVRGLDDKPLRKGAFLIGWNEAKTKEPKAYLKLK